MMKMKSRIFGILKLIGIWLKFTFEDGIDSDIIKITGPTLDVLLKVASDLQMNGMVLMDREK